MLTHTTRAGDRARVILLTVCGLVLSSIPPVTAQPTVKISPTDADWKAGIEAAGPGAVFAFEPGVYHGCDVALNSGWVRGCPISQALARMFAAALACDDEACQGTSAR